MLGPWDIVTQVGTGISLTAFLATLGAWAYRRALAQRERLIRTAPPKERPQLVADALEFFRVDTSELTKEQQFQIALAQIEARGKRFSSVVKVIGLIALLSAALTMLAILRDKSGGSDDSTAFKHTIVFTPESPITFSSDSATVTAVVVDHTGKKTNLPVQWRLKYSEDASLVTLSQNGNSATVKPRNADHHPSTQFELIAEYLGETDTASGAVYVVQPQSMRFRAGSGFFAASPLPKPVVYLIDSRERTLVYNRSRYLSNGTNADDIDGILRDLPIVRRIEVITRDWSRQGDMMADDPNLIVIHASAFERETDPHDINRRFEGFIQYVTTHSNRVHFLVYSRGPSIVERIPGTNRTIFAKNLAQRLNDPSLEARIHTFHVTPFQGVYWDASTAVRLKHEVESILHLQQPSPTTVSRFLQSLDSRRSHASWAIPRSRQS